ncbi:unnamed protein product [Caenorhabditis brenneri]
MKLLKFPVLILEQILKSMNYPQLFFLSFCSNKTRRLITFFKYNLIGFSFCFGQYSLRVFFQDKNRQHCLVCKILSFRAGAVSSEILEHVDEKTTPACLMRFYRKSEDSDALLDIQKHIFETFSVSRKLYFTAIIDDINYYRYIPGVERFNLMEKKYEVEVVEELIRNHSELKAVTIFNDLVGDISPDSNIFDVRNLTIQYPSRPFTEFTDHYRGRFAVFCTPNIRDARVFIDRWLRKECCDNLNNAIFFNTTGRPFDDTLLVNFGQKRIDRTTMPTVPEKYPFDKDDLYYIGGGSDKLITDGSYYAERFDGKFATIAYWDTYVVFSVWDKRPW